MAAQPQPNPSQAGDVSAWWAELDQLDGFIEEATNPLTKELLQGLRTALLEALTDPNHPINTGVPGVFPEPDIEGVS